MVENSDRVGMGPVEFALLEFPQSAFDGRVAAALSDLVEREIVAIVDLLMVTKDGEGHLRVVELVDADSDVAELFADVDGEVMWLLSDEDVAMAADTMQPGTIGVLVVWENTWARGLRAAVGEAGGRLVIHDRLDADEVTAAMESSTGG